MKGNVVALVPAPGAEHVCLESDEFAVPDVRAARKIQAGVVVRSRVRGGSLALDVFDYHFLAVNAQRRRAPAQQYALGLRFVDPSVGRRRHFPTRWLQATLGLLLLSAGAAWWVGSSSTAWWENSWITACVLLWSSTLCSVMFCIYRTTETITLYSRHGHATLLEFVGGLGTFRALRAFETKLAAHIRHSLAAARDTPKAQWLRDEMREHVRLRDLGVLTDEDYEASKGRILRQHG
jgi:hypothetical protein